MTAPERRCERSDLPESMCAHCRGDLAETPREALDGGPLFTARFGGRCAGCDGPIHEGETIAALVDGSGYACTGCLS